jgi:hypothetical protein
MPPAPPVSGPKPLPAAAQSQNTSLPEVARATNLPPGDSKGAGNLARSNSARLRLSRQTAGASQASPAPAGYDMAALSAWVESAATPEAKAAHVEVATKFTSDLDAYLLATMKQAVTGEGKGEDVTVNLIGLSPQALALTSLPPIPPCYSAISLNGSQAKSLDLTHVAPHLAELEIAHTALRGCPLNGLKMPKLFRVDMKGAHLMTGPADFTGARNLEGIRAVDTGVTRVNCQGLSKLKFVHLGGATQLGEIPNMEGCTAIEQGDCMKEWLKKVVAITK